MKWLPSLRRETSETEAPNVAAADPGDAPAGSSVDSTLADSQSPAISDVGPQCPSIPFDDATEVLPAGIESQRAGVDDAIDSPVMGGVPADAFEKLGEELLRKQQALNDEQQALKELFATRLRSDEAQGRAVEKLHDELRQYKSNFIRQQLLPVLKEVIFCHDFVVAQGERCAPDQGPAPARELLDATRQMLVDLLFKYDIEPYRTEEERFDPKTQQCTQTVPSPREEADKTVAARGLPGFRGPEGIVRREQVSVYKFTPGAD